MTAYQCKDYPLVSAVLDEPVDRLCRPLAQWEEYAALESALRIRDSRIAKLEELVLDIEVDAGGDLYAKTMDWSKPVDWFGIRDSLFNS